MNRDLHNFYQKLQANANAAQMTDASRCLIVDNIYLVAIGELERRNYEDAGICFKILCTLEPQNQQYANAQQALENNCQKLKGLAVERGLSEQSSYYRNNFELKPLQGYVTDPHVSVIISEVEKVLQEEERLLQQRKEDERAENLRQARRMLEKDIHKVKEELLPHIIRSLQEYPNNAKKLGKRGIYFSVKKTLLGFDAYNSYSGSSYKQHQGWHVGSAKIKYYNIYKDDRDYREGRCFVTANGRFYVALQGERGAFYTEIKSIVEVAKFIFQSIVSSGNRYDEFALLYQSGNELKAVQEYFSNLQ